jgi:hypothetical protein
MSPRENASAWRERPTILTCATSFSKWPGSGWPLRWMTRIRREQWLVVKPSDSTYFGCTLGSLPGAPGAGTILIVPSSPGGLARMPGSTPVGGHTTPFESASRSLGLAGAGLPRGGGDGPLESSCGHCCEEVGGASSAQTAPSTPAVAASSTKNNACAYTCITEQTMWRDRGSGSAGRPRPGLRRALPQS